MRVRSLLLSCLVLGSGLGVPPAPAQAADAGPRPWPIA